MIVPCILFCTDQLFYSIIMQFFISYDDTTDIDSSTKKVKEHALLLQTINATLPILSGLSLIPLVIKQRLLILCPLIITDVLFGISIYLRKNLRDPVYIPQNCNPDQKLELFSCLVYFSDLSFAIYIVPCLLLYRLYIFAFYYSLVVLSKFLLQTFYAKFMCNKFESEFQGIDID